MGERDRTVVGARIVPLAKGAEPAGNIVRSTGLIPADATRCARPTSPATPDLLASDIHEKNGRKGYFSGNGLLAATDLGRVPATRLSRRR